MSNRIATLNTINDRWDENLSDGNVPGEFPIADRVRQVPQAAQGDSVIYWEAQGKDRMCALHCLNTLLQGPVFTEIDLSSVALHLDEEERKLVYAASGSNQELSELLAGGSSNAADDGFFSISVLEECLKRNGISCIAATGAAMRAVISDPTGDEAFICNHHEHWFSVRKLRGKWYNLDSLKPAPSRVGEFYISAFLYDLINHGYSVFVVRSLSTHPLPMPDKSKLIRPLNANQFYLTDRQIDALVQLDKDYHAKTLQAETNMYGDGNVSGTSQKPSINTQQGQAWPEGGRRLNETIAADSVTTTAIHPDDDPQLEEALRLSMEEFVSSLPHPPKEPEADDPEAITLQVRLPNQERLVRRFKLSDEIQFIFHWLELEAQTIISPHTTYQLIATFPRRILRRVRRQEVEFEGNDCKSDDFTHRHLTEIFTAKQEAFMLQII